MPIAPTKITLIAFVVLFHFSSDATVRHYQKEWTELTEDARVVYTGPVVAPDGSIGVVVKTEMEVNFSQPKETIPRPVTGSVFHLATEKMPGCTTIGESNLDFLRLRSDLGALTAEQRAEAMKLASRVWFLSLCKEKKR